MLRREFLKGMCALALAMNLPLARATYSPQTFDYLLDSEQWYLSPNDIPGLQSWSHFNKDGDFLMDEYRDGKLIDRMIIVKPLASNPEMMYCDKKHDSATIQKVTKFLEKEYN